MFGKWKDICKLLQYLSSPFFNSPFSVSQFSITSRTSRWTSYVFGSSSSVMKAYAFSVPIASVGANFELEEEEIAGWLSRS
jgi:hypothetical protein